MEAFAVKSEEIMQHKTWSGEIFPGADKLYCYRIYYWWFDNSLGICFFQGFWVIILGVLCFPALLWIRQKHSISAVHLFSTIISTLLLVVFCRVKQGESIITKSNRSLRFILLIASLYCLWCASQIYWRYPPQPAIGEEADLGVLIFLIVYFFLPHSLCILSLNPKEESSTDISDKQLLPL